MGADHEARIRERAYALWVQAGREDGKADDFWYRAEREIREEGGGAGAEDASVFIVPDSEMLTGEPDAGAAAGAPSVAALGTAPVAPAKPRRAPAKPVAKGAKAPAARKTPKTT